MLLTAGTYGRTVFVEKYDRQQISKLQTINFCTFAWVTQILVGQVYHQDYLPRVKTSVT